MNSLNYQIEFYDCWNTSSGLSGGALADTLCLKDKNGLPYLPGKTVKGLFREAAELLECLKHEGITDAFINHVFGEKERKQGDGSAGQKTVIATSFFGNATLNAATAKAILEESTHGKEESLILAPQLFEQIATTALEATGLAQKHSLRRTEYALPCTLYGEIMDADEYKKPLADCAAFIKRLGLNRHRGYGRCKISFL